MSQSVLADSTRHAPRNRYLPMVNQREVDIRLLGLITSGI